MLISCHGSTYILLLKCSRYGQVRIWGHDEGTNACTADVCGHCGHRWMNTLQERTKLCMISRQMAFMVSNMRCACTDQEVLHLAYIDGASLEVQGLDET